MAFRILFSFLVLSMAANGYTACLSPEQVAIQIELANRDRSENFPILEVESNTTLCRGETYSNGFAITQSNVRFDCNGAKIRFDSSSPHYHKHFGIAVHPDLAQYKWTDNSPKPASSHNNLQNIQIVSSNARCNISGFHHGIRVLHSVSDPFKKQYDRNDPSTPFQPAKNILISGYNIYDNVDSGINMRAEESEVSYCLLRHNMINLHVDADSHHNKIHDCEIRNAKSPNLNWGRSGIVLDSSWGNRIYKNKISNNFMHGIAIYKNCGEHGSFDYYRKYHSQYNQIYDNEIWGHNFRNNGAGMTITRGAGIALGLRQGLMLVSPESQNLDEFQTCGDLASHMYPSYRLWRAPQNYYSSLINSPYKSGRKRPSPSPSWQSYSYLNRNYYGPHNDFVDRNQVYRNRIHSNTIGVYVAGDHNQVTDNYFYDPSVRTRNYSFDIFYGNVARDERGSAIVGLRVQNNRYLINPGVVRLGSDIPWGSHLNAYTSSESFNSMGGWSSEKLRSFSRSDDFFAKELILYFPALWQP